MEDKLFSIRASPHYVLPHLVGLVAQVVMAMQSLTSLPKGSEAMGSALQKAPPMTRE